MAQPTINDVQAIEPILTNLLVGYQQEDARFVADRVFPAVAVNHDSGTYYAFSKKYWFRNEMRTRAPGSQFARADVGVETGTYATLQYALAYPIADEVKANNLIPMDLESMATRWLAQQSLLNREIKFATDFMATGKGWGTDNTTATDWDDFTSGDPLNDVLTARRTISDNTGFDANAMVLGYIVHQALVMHPDIVDRVKYVQMAGPGNVESALATMFGVDRYLIGKAVYSNTNEAADFSATQIIDDDCLVCHVAPAPGIFTASGGYTFAWAGGGGMGSADRWRDEGNKADLIRAWEQWDQKMVAGDLGYFFSDIV